MYSRSNMEPIIKGVLTGIILAYIGYTIKKESVKGKLFYSRWMVWLGVACLGLVLSGLYALLTGKVKNENGEYFAVGLVVLFFGIGAIASFWEYKVTSGDYNDEKISFCTPWSKCKLCKWAEIDKITYNDYMHWYVLHCKSGIKIRFSSYLTGIDDFIQFANQKNVRFEI